jgi:transcriptional regulator with XRE-family HTH domain
MKLLEWRQYRGFSQEQLAAEAGVSKTTVNRLEHDSDRRARGDQLKRIATALNVDVKDLDHEPPGSRTSRPLASSDAGKARESTDVDDDQTLDAYQAWRKLRSADIRRRFDLTEREVFRVGPVREEPSAVTRMHLQKVLDRGLSLDQVEAVLFVTVVDALALAYDSRLGNRLHEHRLGAKLLRERFAQVLLDAERLAPIVFLNELTGGGDMVVHTWARDLTAEDIRGTLHAIERWESAYAPALEAWIGAGPDWDADFDKPLADHLEEPAVRLGLIPPSTLPPAPTEGED